LSLKIFKSDGIKGTQNFVIFWSVLDNRLHWTVLLLFEDFVITISGKWTSHGHTNSSTTCADNVANCLVELMLFKDLITGFYLIIAYLTISDQDDVLVVHLDNSLGNTLWRSPTTTLSLLDNLFQTLFVDC
jgi:hypothetical protein